jgi:hypothetical protein
VRHTLDEAIGPAPVSTIDVNDVVARARRGNLWRRLAVGGAAGGTALAAAGIVVALTLTSTSSALTQSEPASATPTSTSTSTETVHDGAAPVRTGETSDQTGQRLVTALTYGLSSALPGVSLSDGPTGQPGVALFAEDGGFTSDTVLRTANRDGEIFFESWPGGAVPVPTPTTSGSANEPAPPVAVSEPTSCAQLPADAGISAEGYPLVNDCSESIGLDGQVIVAVTQRCPDCPGHPTLRIDAFVTWTNARVDLAVVRDTKRSAPNESATAPLLSRDQLVDIALNPDLTITH